MEKIIIFDTTLRDGQQSPGASMSIKNNLKYAELAIKLNINILEAGFPSSSDKEYESVNEIAKIVADIDSPLIVAALCQSKEKQLIKTMRALEPLRMKQKARVHIYLPVSNQLMQASLGVLANKKTFIIKRVFELVPFLFNFDCLAYHKPVPIFV
jgi:2-isopropylmalate synthase